MARIRSIHPGLFTDEAFVSASPFARLLIIGIWCEAFDDGCFEVKPLTLKMRVFPADNVDVAGLLNELEGLGYFRRFDAKGKNWAALRNFQKYQRPKKPNKSGVLPPEMHDFVGKNANSGETGSDVDGGGTPPVPHQSGSGGEKSRQRKEEGGKGRKEPPSLREDGRSKPAEVLEPEREPELAFRTDPAKPRLHAVNGEVLAPEVSEPPCDPDAALYRRGREVLGENNGAMITNLKRHFGGNIADARAALEYAATRDGKVAYIAGILANKAGRGGASPRAAPVNPRLAASRLLGDHLNAQSH